MTRRIASRFVAALVLAVTLVVFLAGPASAQSADDFAPSSGGECKPASELEASASSGEATFERANLPIDRWSGGTTSFHTRLGAKITDDVRQKMSRDAIAPMQLAMGNGMWSMAAGLTSYAENFDLLESAGCSADLTAAAIGRGLFNNGAAALVAVVGLFTVFWRARNGDAPPWRDLGKIAGTLALAAILLNGAMETESTGELGSGSPGWFAVRIDGIASGLMAPVTRSVVDQSPGPAGFASAGDRDYMSCKDYIAELRNRHESAGGAQVPMVMSAMWEQAGLAVWSGAQFGTQNDFANFTACRLLERQANVQADEQWAITTHNGTIAGTLPPMSGDDQMFFGGNNTTRDQRTIFWAACRWNGSAWYPHPQWSQLPERPVSADDCHNAWNDGTFSGDGPFEWPDKPDEVAERTEGNPQVANFMFNLHGDAVSDALILSLVYQVGALVMLLIFGLLALAVIVAKIASVVMIALVFIVLVMSLIPGQDRSKAGKYLRFFIGVTFYSFGLQIILALTVIVTAFIVSAGSAAFGPGSIGSLISLSIAPVAAVVVLHLVMKEAIGMPSIFKPSSALAWGTAAGAAGAGVGVGIDRMARRGAGSVRRGVAHGVGQRATSGSGRRRDRRHGMAPDGEGRDRTGPPTRPEDGPPPTPTPTAAERRAGRHDRRTGAGRYDDRSLPARYALGARDNAVAAARRARTSAGQHWASAREKIAANKGKWAAGVGGVALWGGAAGVASVAGAALAAAASPVGLAAAAGYAVHRRRKSRRQHVATHGMSAGEARDIDSYNEMVRRRREQTEGGPWWEPDDDDQPPATPPPPPTPTPPPAPAPPPTPPPTANRRASERASR